MTVRVLTVGGGSGGHVTPVRAVINELSRDHPDLEVRFVCDKKFAPQAADIMSHANVPVRVDVVAAGKLRRYHGVSWGKQLLDIPTTLRNLRDTALIAAGFVQSMWLLLTWRPDVVFTKGGYVCLPVGIAARLCRVPLVIHDSDAHPGLTNRVLSRWARYIATGAPLENYPYPTHKSRYVGIPVDGVFQPLSAEERSLAKAAIGLVDTTRQLVVVTGGGLGARRVNDAMVRIGQAVVDRGASIYHIAGKDEYKRTAERAPHSVHYTVVPFVAEGMAQVLGAADVVVTRAGATTLAELAALARPVVIVPNAILSGGHQLKNAAVYEEASAAIVVDERTLADSADPLETAITTLLADQRLAVDYSQRLHSFAKPEAAADVAKLILKAARPGEIQA